MVQLATRYTFDTLAGGTTDNSKGTGLILMNNVK